MGQRGIRSRKPQAQGSFGRRSKPTQLLTSARRRAAKLDAIATAEQLEPRLALTVGYFTNTDTVFVHVDGVEGQSNAYLKGTTTGELLVSDNPDFLNAGVVENVGNLDNMLVFSGTARKDEFLDAERWWVIGGGTEGQPAITGLQLAGDGQMYAFGLIEGDSVSAGSGTQTFSAIPSALEAEVYGTVSYLQPDGTISRWYFSNFNPNSGVFDAQEMRITAGPGVQSDGNPNGNQANRNNPGLFVPVSPLPVGGNRPTAIRLVQDGNRWNRRIEIEWLSTPVEPPVINATYPVATPVAVRNIIFGSGGGVEQSLQYRSLRQITRSGTLSRGTLNYRVAGAYSTGQAGGAAAVGRVSGFLETGFDLATTHRSWDADDQTAVDSNTGAGALKPGGRVATGVSASLNAQTLQEQFNNVRSALSPLSRTAVTASFTADQRNAELLLATNFTYEVALEGNAFGFATAPSRDYSYDGVNVHAGGSPQLLDTRYITWTRDGAASVTFSPGPTLAFDDITVELTSPESFVNINSPIIARTTLDLRATNIIVNAETQVDGDLYVGRSTQLAERDGSDRPRLTLSQAYGDTPTMQPENWVVEGITPVFTPIFGENGSIDKLIVPAGGEGYGYDPGTSPEIILSAPAPQRAEVKITGTSGSIPSVGVVSAGNKVTGSSQFLLEAEEGESYSMVQKITVGGIYDFFNGGPVVAEAVPLVVVDKPSLATSDEVIGYGKAAVVEAEWTTGIKSVDVDFVSRTLGPIIPTVPPSIPATFTLPAGDTGLIRQAATISPINIGVTKITPTTAIPPGGEKPADAEIGRYDYSKLGLLTSEVGAGFDPSRTYTGEIDLGGGVTGVITSNEFAEGILALSVTDGGLNYDPDERVGFHVITKLAAEGIVLQPAYTPSLTSDLAEGSTFLGQEISLSAVTSVQTGTRDLFEYLKVGMPLRGGGLAADAYVAGVDYSAGIVSVSPGGIVSNALLGAASVYPHEYWVSNQPLVENIQGLTGTVTLAEDPAILKPEVSNDQLLAVSILEPPDNPYDGVFPGRKGGSGYKVLPDINQYLRGNVKVEVGGTFPAILSGLSSELAEATVETSGSNYLASEVNRTGFLTVAVDGGGRRGTINLDVVNGRLTGQGEFLDRGAGFASADEATVIMPDPEEYLEGQAEVAKYRAIVSPDGIIRETIRIDGGSEYVVEPNIFIQAPLSFSDGRAVANVDLLSGRVTGIDVQVSGSGYSEPPVVVIEPPGPEGVGRRAQAIVTIEGGRITKIELVDPGAGYTFEPQVTILSPSTPAVVETVEVNAPLRIDGEAEIYVGEEARTDAPRRGVLEVASQTVLGGSNLTSLYIEARASDINNSGFIRTSSAGDETIQVQLVSTGAERNSGAFAFTSQGAGSIETKNLVIGLENQYDGVSEGNYEHVIQLDTKIETLRVATTQSERTGEAAPYSLEVVEEDNLTVDAVLRAGGDISLIAESGKISISSSLLTDAGLTIEAQEFTVQSPVVSQQGPITISTSQGLTVLNGLTVESPGSDSLRDDITLFGQTGVIIQGAVSALNNVRLRSAGGGINSKLDVDDTSLISTAGRLVVDAQGDVNVRTAVAIADIRAGGYEVSLVEADDIGVDIQAARVDLVAMGVDPGAYGVNARALEGILRDVATASISAPFGSVDIESNTAGRFEIIEGNRIEGLQAAGGVRINALATEVLVRDAPLAGGAAREVRYAINGQLPSSAEYDIAGTIEGKGKINGEEQPFYQIDDEKISEGDLVLVKDEVRDARRNGIYRIERIGGGVRGFANWLLTRADDAQTDTDLPSGTYVHVADGIGASRVGQGYYQITYVPRNEQVVTVGLGSQLVVPTAALIGLEAGVRVTGDGVLGTAEVAGIDWENRVVTLGVPAGVSVQPLSNGVLRSALGDGVLEEIVRKYEKLEVNQEELEDNPITIDLSRYVGLMLEPDAESQKVGADHLLVQAINTAIGGDQKVRLTSRDGELSGFAEAIGGAGEVIVLALNSAGRTWESQLVGGEGFVAYPGFAQQPSDGRVLNPAVRSQLEKLPIESVAGDTITVSQSFFRWDLVKPGQRLSGDGVSETAQVVTVSPATRTVVLSEGAFPSVLPQEVPMASASSPNAVNLDEYELLYLHGITGNALELIEPGMLVIAPSLATNTTVAAVSVERSAIAVRAGSILSWGDSEGTRADGISVVDSATGQLMLGATGAKIAFTTQPSTEPSYADAIVLQVDKDSGFSDLDFAKLRIGMSVSGKGIREGAILLAIDTANRTVGITPGSIIGQVTSISFHNPVHNIVAELKAGVLSLATDGSKTLQNLIDEGLVSENLTATVAGARTTTQSSGTFSDELYRLIQSDQDATELLKLVQEARTRFLDDTEDQSWQQNVVLGQEVVTDVVRFDALSLDLAAGETIQDLVIADRADLALPAYVREGTGTRVVAIVATATNELVVRRWEHVNATDEFVTQSVSSEVKLADWEGDGVAKAAVLSSNSNILVVAYKDETAETWREATVSGLNSTFNLLADAPTLREEATSVVVFDETGTAYYPSLPAGGVKITAATHIQGNDFLIAYSVGSEYVVMKWNSTTEGYGTTEMFRTSVEPRSIALAADGNSLVVGTGASGVAFYTYTDINTTPRRTVTYDLAESIDGVVTSSFTGAWGELAFVDAAGSIVTLQEIDRYDRILERSRVVGVDYRTGIVSLTETAFGVGEDLQIERVGDYRYAVAPAASLTFLTEAEIEPRAVRLNDGDGAVDTGGLLEVEEGTFKHGYLVIDDLIESIPGDATNDADSLWQALADQLGGSSGGYVYAKNAQGQWVYFAQLTGVDSYNRILGVQSASGFTVSPAEQLLRITSGTDSTELMIAANHVEGTDYRELQDGSQIRLNRIWPDDLSEAGDQVDRWQGNEVFCTVQSTGQVGIFVETSPVLYPVTLAGTFFSGNAIRPGMAVSGDGIDPGTHVGAVDLKNNIVWIDTSRDLSGVGDSPAERFVQFSYVVDRPSGLIVSERLGTVEAGNSPLTDDADYSSARLVAGITEIKYLSSADGTNELQKLRAGAEVLGNYEGAIASNGTVTGVDWRIGLVGVSEGVVLDSQRLETPSAHLVHFANGDGSNTDTLSVDVEFAASRPVGRRDGMAISVAGIDGGAGSWWPSIGLGGDVYLEIGQRDQAGAEPDVIKIGVLHGYDPQLGQIYLRDITADADRLLNYESDGQPRLLLLGTGFSNQVNSNLVSLNYRADDPFYNRFRNDDGSLELMQIRRLGNSFSLDAAITRLGVSTSASRIVEKNWMILDADGDTSWTVDGRRGPVGDLTLAEMVGMTDRLLTGDSVVPGSVVTTVGMSYEGIFLGSSYGVLDGDGGSDVGVAFPVVFSNESSGHITGSYTQEGASGNLLNGDLVSLADYDYYDHLATAFREAEANGKKVTVSAVGVQSSEKGAWLKSDAAVIGIDPENAIIVLEPGAILTNDVTNIRFFSEGQRLLFNVSDYLDALAPLPSGEYLPDAAVERALAGIDATGIFHGPDIVSVRLQRDGIPVGNLPQSRFSSFHRLGISGNSRVFRVDETGGLVLLGDLVGVDAENTLIAFQAVDAQAASTISTELSSDGGELRFEVDGSLLESRIGGSVIKPAIVQSSSAAAGREAGGTLSSDEIFFVTRLGLADLDFDLTQIKIGDLVSDSRGYVAKQEIASDGRFDAVRVVGVDHNNRIVAIAWTDADGNIIRETPALVESIGLSSVVIGSSTRQDTNEPLVFDVAVSGGRRTVAGTLAGDLLRGSGDGFSSAEHFLGWRLAALTGAELGLGSQILGSTGSLGLVSVTPGTVVARTAGNLQAFEIRAEIQVWSEGALRSTAILPAVLEGSLFSSSRGVIEPNQRAGAILEANLGSQVFVEGEYRGFLTGYDPAIGLLGITESEIAGGLTSDDVVDVELSELVRRGDYQINRESVVGSFSGTRLMAQSSGFFDPAGNPVDSSVIEIGMPVWDGNSNLIARVSGLAAVTSSQFGDAVLIGLTANNPGQSGRISLDGLIAGSERVRFGGQLTDGSVIGPVAELGMLNGRMPVAASGDLAVTNSPKIFHGLSGPRVTVVGQFPPVTDLLGATVTGRSVPANTIITGYDEQLGLIGLSNPIVTGNGSTTIEITPVESLVSLAVTVGDASSEVVGDLNGQTRLLLSDTVALPVSADHWVGKQVTVELTVGGNQTATIRGVDIDQRLIAIDWNNAGSLPNGASITSLTVVRPAAIGVSYELAPGSDLDLHNSTTLFVNISGLSYLQASGGSSVEHEVAVGDTLSLANGKGDFNRFTVTAVDQSLGLVLVEAGAPQDWEKPEWLLSRDNPEWLLSEDESTARIVASVALRSFSGPLGEAANGDEHGFENARFLLSSPDDVGKFFVGQIVEGEGLTAGVDMIVTGVDEDNLLVGVRASGLSLSTISDAYEQRVIDPATSSSLVTLVVGQQTLAFESSSRAATPVLNGNDEPSSPPTALLNVGRRFPFAWLHAAFEQVKSYRNDPSDQSREQAIYLEGLDGHGEIVFQLSHDLTQSGIASYDPRLGMLQLDYQLGYNLTDIRTLRISLDKSVERPDNLFEPDDLVYEVGIESFSIVDPASPASRATAHRIYVNGAGIADIETSLGGYAVIAGDGLRGQQRITGYGTDQIGDFITLAAGGIDPAAGLHVGTQLTLSAGINNSNSGKPPIALSVERVENFLVGEIGANAVGIEQIGANPWQHISNSSQLVGSYIQGSGNVAGYDVANGIVYLESSEISGAGVLAVGVSQTNHSLASFRSSLIGTGSGDRLVLDSSSTIDLAKLSLGSRVSGDNLSSNARVRGIDAAANVIILDSGSVTAASGTTAATVVSTGTRLIIDTVRSSRSRGTLRSGAVIKIDDGFEQFARIGIGQSVSDDSGGLTVYAKVEAIDADNRLVFLSNESINAIEKLTSLNFVDADGEYTAFVSRLSTGTPQVAIGAGQESSTVVGSLDGDLLVIPEVGFTLFRDYGADLLGTRVIGGALPVPQPILGYDPVTGVIALPAGSIQYAVANMSESDRTLRVFDGLAAESWSFETLADLSGEDNTTATITFSQAETFIRKILVGVSPGQPISGVGIASSAVVEKVDEVRRTIEIRSRNGEPVIALAGGAAPRQVSFSVPSTLELGATYAAGSSIVVFEVDEFGRNDILVTSGANQTIREVGPAVGDISAVQATQLASRANETNARRESWAEFAKAERDAEVVGPGVQAGSFIYRPMVSGSGSEVRLQLYSGQMVTHDWIIDNSGGDFSDYKQIVWEGGGAAGAQWFVEMRAVEAYLAGLNNTNQLEYTLPIYILGTEKFAEGDLESAKDWVAGLGEPDKPNLQGILRISPEGLTVNGGGLSELLADPEKWNVADVVIGERFKPGLLSDSKAFTAVEFLRVSANGSSDGAATLPSIIQTENAQGITRFIVGNNTDPATGLVDNRTPGSLGKMVSVWKATAAAIDLARTNPGFTFQFDVSVDEVRLSQELPSINVPIMIDGEDRFGGAGGRVIVDGSQIALDVRGDAIGRYADGNRVDGFVFSGFGQNEISEISKQAGVRGLSFIGFEEGAAIRLTEVNNILVEDNVFGVTDDARGSADFNQRSNRQGVFVNGNSQYNAVIGNTFAGSNDAAAIVTDTARNNFIVANTIGVEDVGTNRIGVNLEAGGNYLGVPSAGFDEVLSGTVLLNSRDPDPANAKQRIINFLDEDVDLSTVVVGMRVVLESYPTVMHEVIGVDLVGRRLTIKEDSGSSRSPVGGALSQLEATVGLPVKGVYNKNVISLTNETYALARDRIFVGQSISGPDILSGTRIIGIEAAGDGSGYVITLSNRLIGFGYDQGEGGGRLVAFGNQARNVISQSTNGVLLGVGWEYVKLSIYDGILIMQEDAAVPGRKFTGWEILKAEIAGYEKFYAVFSVVGSTDNAVYRAVVDANRVDQDAGVLGVDVIGGLEQWDESTAEWVVVTAIERGQKLPAISSVSVTFSGEGLKSGLAKVKADEFSFEDDVVSEGTLHMQINSGGQDALENSGVLAILDGFYPANTGEPSVYAVLNSPDNSDRYYTEITAVNKKTGELAVRGLWEQVDVTLSEVEFEVEEGESESESGKTRQEKLQELLSGLKSVGSDLVAVAFSADPFSVDPTSTEVSDAGLVVQRSGSSVNGTDVIKSYQDAIKILDSGNHVIGDARAATGLKVSRSAGLAAEGTESNQVEISSWAIEVAFPRGEDLITINESQYEILRRMLQDWRSVERDADSDPNTGDNLDFTPHSIRVYGYGVQSNVELKEVRKVGGEWRLLLSDNAFVADLTGNTTLSFGVGWFIEKSVTSLGLRFGDEVVSQRQAAESRVPGVHLPEFTEVREVGVDFIRLSTPLYGQRIQYTETETRGVEGFQRKVVPAEVEASVDANGSVSEITVKTRGVYLLGETLLVAIDPPEEEEGEPATATAEVVEDDDKNLLLHITVTNPGSGYSQNQPPAVRVSEEPRPMPRPIYFTNSRFGNTIADNDGVGVGMTLVGHVDSLWQIAAGVEVSSRWPVAPSPRAVAANVFGLLSANAETVVAENRGGTFDAQVFKVLFGIDVAEGGTVALRKYVNDWDKEDQFGNRFADQNFEFVIPLPNEGIGAGERPTFWYL